MKHLKKIWYMIGVKLFGKFFTRLFQLKQERRKQLIQQRAIAYKMKRQGIYLFDINGVKVFARNRNNAEKKAAKIKVK
jgi:hypothetical protein